MFLVIPGMPKAGVPGSHGSEGVAVSPELTIMLLIAFIGLVIYAGYVIYDSYKK